MAQRPTRHLHGVARTAGLRRAWQWIHVYDGAPVPPLGGGSFNHLIWDLARRHPDDHLVIGTHFDGFAARTDLDEASLVHIAYEHAVRPVDRLKHRLQGRVVLDNRDFIDEAMDVIAETACRQILVWGSMRSLPYLRERFPNHTLAYAQRYFEHGYDAGAYYNHCDIVLMQTHDEARFAFERHAIQGLIVHVPNGVELDTFRPVRSAAEQRAIRARLGLPAQGMVVVFPSKLNPNKGTAYLWEWIRRFGRSAPDVHFLVVGDWHQGVARGLVRQMMDGLGRCANVTWKRGMARADMADVYRAADVSLMPGVWREGMSMSALESMASGLPLVAVDRGIYHELLVHGWNGLLCRPEALLEDGASALLRLRDDVALRRRLGANARAHMAARLSRSKCLEQFDHFFAGRYEAIDPAIGPPPQGRPARAATARRPPRKSPPPSTPSARRAASRKRR